MNRKVVSFTCSAVSLLLLVYGLDSRNPFYVCGSYVLFIVAILTYGIPINKHQVVIVTHQSNESTKEDVAQTQLLNSGAIKSPNSQKIKEKKEVTFSISTNRKTVSLICLIGSLILFIHGLNLSDPLYVYTGYILFIVTIFIYKLPINIDLGEIKNIQVNESTKVVFREEYTDDAKTQRSSNELLKGLRLQKRRREEQSEGSVIIGAHQSTESAKTMLGKEYTNVANTQILSNEPLFGLSLQEFSKAPQNISVILPAHNEETSIGSIVLLTKLYADKVIVVDDGSVDRTADIARKAGAEVIVHDVNKGKGSALKTGFAVAVDMGADIIVTMDSDAQHNPAEIPKLVAPIIGGNAEMVNGSRYLNKQDKNTPIYRRVGQTVLDGFTNMNSGLKISDSQSGFRAFSASIIDIFRFKANGMAIESEMLADAGKAGVRIKEVEIGVRYDVNCSTKKPIQHAFEVFIIILKDIEFNRPLYYFTFPGVVLGICGLYIGFLFLKTFAMGGSIDYMPTIPMILLIVIGTFLTLTGIILHSISKRLS